ncbi:MAG: heme NO-binding domain-containing protein [Ascidiaceihabitans sp.]|nr:heme NO-binding domain-containing protein [Ascidiaceihabitans sp.]
MKGTVFVELLKMAEDAFGEDVVDSVLDKADLENDGAYTSVGNYSCAELMKVVEAFSEHSGLSPEVLQRKFGNWMHEHFAQNFPEFYKDKDGSFDMLEALDGEIHVEVRKLYPEAELPRFTTNRKSDNHLEMVYSSPRPLVGFCHGLIEACTANFGETAEIERGETEAEDNCTTFQIKVTS